MESDFHPFWRPSFPTFPRGGEGLLVRRTHALGSHVTERMKYEATEGKNRRTWKTRATIPLFHRVSGVWVQLKYLSDLTRTGGGRNNGGERSRRLLGRQIVSLLDRQGGRRRGPFRWRNYGYHLTCDISNHVGEIVVKLQRYEGIRENMMR